MKKAIFALSISLLGAPFLSATVIEVSAAPDLSGSRPNIILVMTDDQGMGDLSCMGNPIVKTPHIDKFYEQSTRFTDYQVSPTCAPTRAAILSGQAPFKVGVTHTIYQRELMSLDTFTVAQALKSAGYATALFGKWHLGDDLPYLPQSRGFDEVLMHGAGGISQGAYGDFSQNSRNPYFDNVLLHNDTVVQTKGFCTDLFTDAALSWAHQKNTDQQPFFAFVAYNAPHAPFIAPEKYKKRFLEAGYDDKTAGRYGMIENLDDNFGRIMTQLEAWDILENTLVIFTTDNGMSNKGGKKNGKRFSYFNAGMKGTKSSGYEGGTHVPLFFYWKGVLSEGVDIDPLVSHFDLYPTFCELAGVELPEDIQSLDGLSLLPLLKSPTADFPKRTRFLHKARWKPGEREQSKYYHSAVRTERWRLVHNKELYDIQSDPGESTNVAADYPEVVQQLGKEFDLWWDSMLPFMINEGLPKVERSDFPFPKRYNRQLEERGIPEWSPPSYTDAK
ncbi:MULTISPECIES: arylsulfatase [unclassified Lentimonas]|uniref:arylsulfatase n=1 Tax=unclassified Lentimonas TaxID=2630993 RepID=UPI00132551E1|nr:MULTISPECIES: arylsulfatase [unclassified Lentimonas]CAA6690010.1 Unannotated [Lentimonas sp. CC10]CAA6691085.1 Unannotated [Lentimonas sp. CC19]CAA7069301.1 Unannotated [Lentimonas sp. CC11]